MYMRILEHGYSHTWIFTYISSHVVTCGIFTDCIRPFQFLVLILSIRDYNICKERKMHLSSFEGIIKSCQTFDSVRSSPKWRETIEIVVYWRGQMRTSARGLGAPSLGDTWKAQGGCSFVYGMLRSERIAVLCARPLGYHCLRKDCRKYNHRTD